LDPKTPLRDIVPNEATNHPRIRMTISSRVWDMAEVVEHLPTNHEALGSISSTKKKNDIQFKTKHNSTY
jgi:hypothetical protein